MGNLEKNAGNRGHIIIFFPLLFLTVTLKKSTKIQLGENIRYFSPCVFIFSPLGHAIIVLLSQTVYWGENMARGNSYHTMFQTIMGNLEKNPGKRGHNVIYFPLLF
jgi:hypothetical protein